MKSFLLDLLKTQTRSKIDLNWLNELDSLDDLTALEKTTSYLSKFTDDHSIPPNKQLETLFVIDRYNRLRIRKVSQQYIKFEHLRAELDIRISEVIYYYHRQLNLNYQKQITELLKLTDRLRLHNTDFPLAVARAMHAIFSMICLRKLTHQPCPAAAWSEIFQLYRIAETENLLDMPVKLYDDMNPLTIDTLFIHGCMFDSMSQCTMHRQQVKLAIKLIRNFAPETRSISTYNEKSHLYFIDLDEDKGARRIRHMTLTPACRFWDISELLIKIDLIMHSIKAKKPLDAFGLGSLANHPYLLDTLTIMKTEWTGYRRQRRKEERKHINKMAVVSWGIASVTNQVKVLSKKRLGATKSFEERLASHSLSNNSSAMLNLYATGERWVISDESSNGFGAEVEKEYSLLLKQDKLTNVALPDPKEGNIIGIVRNVVEVSCDRWHVGIEVISRRASLVQVQKVNDVKSNMAGLAENILGIPCLYLPVEEGLSDWPSIIMPRLEFMENSFYEISTINNKVLVRLGRAQDMKDDWARIPIEIQSNTASV